MANEKRLIDANEIEELFYKQVEFGATDLMDAFDDALQDAQTVDAVEVVHGRWVLGNVEPGYFTPGGNRPWVCSKCGEVISYRLDKPMENYCPNCGAKMDGDGNG